MQKEFREFFLRATQVNSGSKADQELGFDIDYIIENKSVLNRFLKGHYPSEDVFKKLFESIAFKLNQEDTAKESEQGLVKLATDVQFNSGLDQDTDNFSLQAKISQIRNLVTTAISTNTTNYIGSLLYSEENYVTSGENLTDSIEALDVALNSLSDYVVTNAFATGMIVMWSGDVNTLPTGWLLCDGTNSTPNLSGKFIVGFDPTGTIDGGDYDAIGNTGGADAVVLQTTNLPSHNHNIKVQGSSVSTGVNVDVLDVNTVNQLNFDNFSSDDTGNTQGHENRPPFYTLAYIIKQ